jgi:hypothetical protein
MLASSVAPAVAPRRNRAARQSQWPTHITLGPYRLRVEFLDRSLMLDRRKLACINLDEDRLELRDDLEGAQLVEAFFESIIRLSHFSKGCQQGCVEEAYTHSFATGMVEFAQRNPTAWVWFNRLLTLHHRGDVRYDKVVEGFVSRPPSVPKRIVVAGRTVAIRSIGKAECGNAFGWYVRNAREAQLYEGLKGNNLAIVALHELTHAVHHVYQLKERDQHGAFRRAQLKGWMSIITHNPTAWRWLAWVMTFPAGASLAPAHRSRRSTVAAAPR